MVSFESRRSHFSFLGYKIINREKWLPQEKHHNKKGSFTEVQQIAEEGINLNTLQKMLKELGNSVIASVKVVEEKLTTLEKRLEEK